MLREHGYPTAHRAAQIDDDHLAADLVVALGRNHVRMLRDMGVPAGQAPDAAVVRPAVGQRTHSTSRTPTTATHDDFEDVYSVIEASLPGLHDWVDEQLAGRGIAS